MSGVLDFQGIMAVFGPWVISFALILVRVGALIIVAPLFSMKSVPVVIKAALVSVLSLMVMSTMEPRLDLVQFGALEIGGAVLVEALVGGIMGFSLMLLFAALAFTGQLIGIQMGFAIANVVDPTSRQQVGILAQILNLFGLALFLAVDGHLYLLQALFKSFETVPLGGASPQHNLIVASLVQQGSEIFSLGLKIGLPVVCVVLLVNCGLATLARTVPQVNIFVIGFLITISIGLLVLGLAIPSTADVFRGLIEDTVTKAVGLLKFF
jgi:flagellar biosynthetic protein FliR